MNNRFKFRAWDKVNKKMNYNNFVVTATGFAGKITEEFLGQCVFRQDDMTADNTCILMQCAGLKDKNGKLIFEGDIINILCKNFTEKLISSVKYCEERAAFTFDYLTDYGQIVPCTMDKTEIEVIGNIYENPELLEI